MIFRLTVCTFLCLYQAINAQQQISGFSDQYRSESNLGDYAFGYNEDHSSGGSFRRETGDRHGNKVGSYGLRIGDGRMRVVNYIADSDGYRVNVISNEPGLSQQEPNRFMEIAKKNFHSIFVPGFMYSAQAPHVTFVPESNHFNENVLSKDGFERESEAFMNQNSVDGSEQLENQHLDDGRNFEQHENFVSDVTDKTLQVEPPFLPLDDHTVMEAGKESVNSRK
ncbi:uncharacterized protein [Parasteatoda tepidariorum]|uniref:uncharacterized protein isoform X1 n=1 Tax=Parasteatoda tepidariorum TaxID=114398 RepID=UPI001C71E185|nr:uncharacterized protein LOC122271554 [Parasteatoda tepidariorum]